MLILLLVVDLVNALHKGDAEVELTALDGGFLDLTEAGLHARVSGGDDVEGADSQYQNDDHCEQRKNHRLEMEVRKGDIVQAGVMISNSEVGLGAVSIQPLVYRLVCTNGMVVNDMGERRHHVGRQAKAVEDSFALYSDETMEAEDKAFLLKLRDTTMAAIDEARFSQVVGRLQESMAVPITGRVQDVVQLTAQSYGINAEEQEGILKYLIEGGDLSLYGLSNAVTRASQDVVSYDRATTLEGIGWQVATMEPAQWKQINQ